MTDRQLIIDGVDVSGCIYYQYNMCTATKDNYGDCSFCCKDYEMKNCYYKQLKRLEFKLKVTEADYEASEQECEKLKESLKVWKYSDVQHIFKINKHEQTLTEIKEIVEPYKMTIKKICGNCKKYDDCHACCYKDINCYKYTSPKTNACEEFTYLDKFIPNILTNNILQKISECEVENDNRN